jgi:queuosine precursor transporter
MTRWCGGRSRRRGVDMLALLGIAFVGTIFLANWMIGHVGWCGAGGVCLVPVGFGLMAPSGVVAIGAAMVLRDFLQRQAGSYVTLMLIVVGAVVSAAIASPALAVASGVAFLLAEAADMAVYTPLRQRRLWLAVLASGAVGSIVDSAVFLYLAFGSLEFLAGQIVGKLWMTVLAAAVLAAHRKAVQA